MIVPNTSKFLGKEFQTGRDLTQGDTASPMIFNIVVDAVVQAVLDVVCRPQEAHRGRGWTAGERNLIFYSDNDRIAGRCHVWVQDAIPATVEFFCRIGLKKNPGNTITKGEYIICTCATDHAYVFFI